jgi:hypothetical protein
MGGQRLRCGRTGSRRRGNADALATSEARARGPEPYKMPLILLVQIMSIGCPCLPRVRPNGGAYR